MKVQHNSQINFGIKLPTIDVVETASVTILKDNGLEGIKNVALKLGNQPLKFPGHQGYRHLAEIYGAKICEKYPEIAEIANRINSLKAENRFIKKDDLYRQVKPMIDKLGQEVDIEI